MRWVFCLLALVGLGKAFPHAEYFFFPQGSFVITVTEAGPYYFTGFHFEKANIYLSSTSHCMLYGSIEKIQGPQCTYLFTVHPAVDHSSGILSLERYEIRDAWGGVLGCIEGKFSQETYEPFLFYDEQHRLFAKSAFDPSGSELMIRTPEGQDLVVCSKTFQYPGVSSDPNYHWTIQEIAGVSLDARFLWPFVALVSEVYWRSAMAEGYY